jgi:hypothetical protein
MRALRSVGLTLGSLGLVALFALPARAADTGEVGSTEIAGGYSYVYVPSDVSGVSGRGIPAGWFFSAGANISDAFSVVGDISGNYRSESGTVAGGTLTVSSNIHTFLAGPRVTARLGGLNFYGQFLAGAARAGGSASGTVGGVSLSGSGSETEFCFAPGAGVDLNLGHRSALRAGVSERFIRVATATSSTTTSYSFDKEFQLQIGLVYRFGN